MYMYEYLMSHLYFCGMTKKIQVRSGIFHVIFFQAGTVTNPAIWLVFSMVRIFLSLTMVTVTLAWVFFPWVFFRLRAWKKINKLFTSLRSVRIVKNYSLGQHFQGLSHSFSLYGPPSWQITYMYTTRERCITMLYQTIENTLAKIHMGHQWKGSM